MKPERNTIIFTVGHQGKEYQVQTREQAYDSLMCLLSEQLPLPGFGICYGGGCCGTCGVEIRDKSSGARKFTLACEVFIDDELSNLSVTIL